MATVKWRIGNNRRTASNTLIGCRSHMVYNSMAALVKHGWLARRQAVTTNCWKTIIVACNKSYWLKNKSNKNIRSRTLESTGESLAAKGFLRSQTGYTPRNDVTDTVTGICQRILERPYDDNECIAPELRYQILNACFQEFNHGVPSARLHSIQTADNIVQFYKTPVDAILPLDYMKTMDLPPNLHIQHEYHRFHPDTDTMFGGVSAFPKSSTITSSLKYKKKYQGYLAKTSWP